MKPFRPQLLNRELRIYGCIHRVVIRDAQWRNRRLPNPEIRNEAELKRALRSAYFGRRPVNSPTVWAVWLRYTRTTEVRIPTTGLRIPVRYAVGRSKSVLVPVDNEIGHQRPAGYRRDLYVDILDAAAVRRLLLQRMPQITDTLNPFSRQ
jgi:hypothetical protein